MGSADILDVRALLSPGTVLVNLFAKYASSTS